MQNSTTDLRTNPEIGKLPIVIKGIKFTNREFDIIACIVHMRGSSKMASLLSISPRTCETHVLNIMRKISCNSREGIVDFIEKSNHSFLLRKHYQSLLAQFDFGKRLGSISAFVGSKTCHIIYSSSKSKNHENFVYDFVNHLKLCGIKTIVHNAYEESVITDELQEHVVYLVSHEEENKNPFNQLRNKALQNQNLFTFLLLDKVSLKLPQELEKCSLQKTAENYHELFLETVKRILWDRKFDRELLDFQAKPISEEVQQEWPKNLVVTKSKSLNSTWKDILKAKKVPSLIIAILGITLLFFIIDKSQKVMKSLVAQDVKADLLIPVESVLLSRSELLSQIDDKLKGKEGIQTIALVGIGGAGKTTLARRYAKQKKVNLVWEINAETKGSLIGSFEALAQTLCKTEEDKNALEEAQDIKNSAKREERILFFVKDKLKSLDNWFLIYDNVENYTTIQKWFPCDPTSWGNGRIIVTTRDGNLQNNVHINSAIHIGELEPAEKLHLFMKIMKDGASLKLTDEQKNAAEKFLTHIPPFPLDVSVTAYYLKTTNLPYEKYLNCLKEHHKDFTTTQEAILKEVGDYTKTRRDIITLSLKKLIETHKDFAELLLLISLLDSQNIPRDLLEGYKNSAVIDNFIHHLKKHSLITTQPDVFSSISTLSIHRNTQESILDYLMKGGI